MKHVLVAVALLLATVPVTDIGAQSAGNPTRIHKDEAVINFSAGTNVLEHKFTPAKNGTCTVTATFNARLHSAPFGPNRVGLEIGQSKLGADIKTTDALTTVDAKYTLQMSRNVVEGVPAQVLLTTYSYVYVNHTLSGIDLIVDCP